MNYDEQYLDRVCRLNVNIRGERRAPHKPLLLLVAIARLLRGERELPFAEAESILNPLLASYAPPVKARHQPELPFWHLCSDKLWEIPDAENFPRQAGGFPQMAALRSSYGHLATDFAEAILSRPDLVQATVSVLLEDHFPESIHDNILAAVGLELPEPDKMADRPLITYRARRRDPKFRQIVLKAYEHRCAISGFRAAFRRRKYIKVACGGANQYDIVHEDLRCSLSKACYGFTVLG